MHKFKLVKFFDQEKYAEEFLNGNLSMNYLGAYWGHNAQRSQADNVHGAIKPQYTTPTKYGQDDRYEGTVVVMKKDASFLPENLLDKCLGDVILRVEGYRYCNLLCMCAIDLDEGKGVINLPDTDYFREHFGKYVVLVKDTEEFLRRLDMQLLHTDYDYIYGRVNYIDMIGDDSITRRHSMQMESNILTHGLTEAMESGQVTDVFDKHKLLRKQKEWRICLYRGTKEEKRYYLPSLGSLRDIAESVKTDDLNTLLLRWYPGMKYSMLQPEKNVSYCGNISRSDLRRKISSDDEYRILFNFG